MKIKAPGLYDISNDDYHTDCAWKTSLSSGDLVAISQNPAKWYAYHWSNPNRFEREDTNAFAFGRAAHAKIVGGEDFDSNYAIRPDEFDSYRSKAAREWRDGEIAKGKTVLTDDDLKTIEGMQAAMEAHPHAREILMKGYPEQSIFWEKRGVVLKARPDTIASQTTKIISDYKTVTSVDERKLRNAVFDYGYAQKLANVTEGMLTVFDMGTKDIHDLSFVLICQEKKPPFEIAMVTIEPADIAYYSRLNDAALDEYIKSAETGIWRGTNDDFVEFSMVNAEGNGWMRDRAARRYGGEDGLPDSTILKMMQKQEIAA